MANTDQPFGFRPVRYLSGSPWNGQMQLYAFSASNSTGPAFKGDMVQFDDTNRATALTDVYAPGIPLIKPVVAAITTAQFRGVIAGFVPEPEFSHTATASLGRMHRLDDTARYAWVVDDPNVIFEAQEDGNDWVSASDNSIGKTVDVAYTAGSTVTGVSKAELDSSDAQTAAVRPWKVLRLTQRVDNFNFTASDSSSNAHYDVMIANSDYAQADTGA